MKTTKTNISKYLDNAAVIAIDESQVTGAIKNFGAKQVMQSPTIWIYEMKYKGETTRFVKCKTTKQWFKKA